MKNSLILAAACLALIGCSSPSANAPRQHSGTAAKSAFKALNGCLGTYNNSPRLPNGRVDMQRLLDELVELRANTYNWLIWHRDTDWEDLQAFLPLARAKHINVWVTLVPPSESPPKARWYSEPFRLDYVRWADELGRLSDRESNLVAWSIDDFCHNLKTFTPETVQAMRAKTRQHNSQFAFVPCCYYKQITPVFAQKYSGLIDGIIFPYRSESTKADLTDAAQVEAEFGKIREVMGRKDLPVMLDVYASAHATMGPSTPEYVRQVMARAHPVADGVLVYCHQDKQKSAQKFAVIKALFEEWTKPGDR
jgi:hypothetical protein